MTYPAGSGGAGHAPVQPPSIVGRRVRPAATRFEGATADYPLDDEGNWVAIDPVDQEVALSLLIPLGSCASAPDVGNTFRELVPQSASLQADAEDRARRSLFRPLSRKDIALDRVAVRPNVTTGGVLVFAYYRNLRSADPSKLLVRRAQP